ncbi:MAG: HD domain-containing protein [Planctomycetota bacterium]|nr:MAG: HD domain-containing protein [Planctomycetota bacterium]
METDPKSMVALSHDPIHGYIEFVSGSQTTADEVCERRIIDHPWVQRLRQIRQLQSAWWVFPTAEHSRFQHVLGVMHLASRVVQRMYPSLQEVDPSVPSLPCVDALMRMAGLLHDVGHGPFGHFFDAHFLAQYGLTHETLGAEIIVRELGDLLRGLRRSPAGEFEAGERVDPSDVAWLIQRPVGDRDPDSRPRWLELLRSLFCGIYTVDNMDFVLRDAFMTGLNPRSFDLDRILYYSWFTGAGLTLHDRGIPALVHFLGVKAELFRSVYFHRTVRGIDLELADLFAASRDFFLPGDPRQHLEAYRELTEFSLLTDVRRWDRSPDPRQRQLAVRWRDWLNRRKQWVMICQRNISFGPSQPERSSIFSSPELFTRALMDQLPPEVAHTEFRVDLARHIHRPHTRGATAGLNFYYDSNTGEVRALTMHALYRQLPVSHTIARIYARDRSAAGELAAALDRLLGDAAEDDPTNM